MNTAATLSLLPACTPVSQADITRVLGEYCFIRLDNGDEAFFHNGHWLIGADGASGEPSVMGLAQRAARAGCKSLRCVDLPVPDDAAGAGTTSPRSWRVAPPPASCAAS